jgi:hypothetical protein
MANVSLHEYVITSSYRCGRKETQHGVRRYPVHSNDAAGAGGVWYGEHPSPPVPTLVYWDGALRHVRCCRAIPMLVSREIMRSIPWALPLTPWSNVGHSPLPPAPMLTIVVSTRNLSKTLATLDGGKGGTSNIGLGVRVCVSFSGRTSAEHPTGVLRLFPPHRGRLLSRSQM